MPRQPLFCLVLLLAAPAVAACLAAPAFADDLVVTVERTVSATERPSIEVRATNAAPVALTLRRVNRGEHVARLGVDVARPEGVERALADYEREVLTRNADLLAAAERTLAAPGEGRSRRTDLDPLGAGLYVVEAAQSDLRARALLLVSDLALVTKRDERGLVAWAVDRTSGAPRAGVGVRVQRGREVLAEAATGADGLARLVGSFPAELHVVAQDGDHLAFGSERWFSPRARGLRVYLVTHQPAYRPGERVEVRGIVRGIDDGGRPVLAPGVTSARLAFVSADQRVLGEIDVPVSEYLGTFAGGFTLPAGALPGRGEVRAEVAGTSHAGPLVIDAYRRPPFAVTARAAAPRVLAGEGLRFDVEARGYDGAVLPRAAVTWALVFHRVEPDLFPADELARLFFGTEQEAFAPQTLAQGNAALDERGRLTLEPATPASLGDGYVTLRATVAGPDGMHVTGSGVCGVAASPVRVALRTDRHLYGPEDLLRVVVRVERADGKPAAGRPGVLTLAREDARAQGAAPEQVWLENRTFTTDERGEARIEWGLREAGRYVLLAAVERVAGEPAGPPASAEIGVWCAGETSTLGYAGERLDLIADKDDYAPGDTARVLVLSPLAGRALLATVEGATLLDARLLTPDGTSALWTLQLGEDHQPNVWLACVGVDRGNLVTGQRMLRLPPRSKRLDVQVAPDAAELAPGAVSGARLTVKDASGKPVDGAEVSLAVVDEALHALFADPGAAVEAFFHPPRRNGVRTGGPLHLASVGFVRRAPPPAKHAERQADGGEPGAAPAPAPAPMPGTHAPPETAGAPRNEAACGAGGRACGAEESGAERPRELVDLDDVTNGLEDAKKSKDDGDGAPAAATRADFRTGVHWSPALRTGADGTVRAEGIRYADTLTRWRLSALAVDASTRVGTARGDVRTKRDVAVEVTLPRFLRVGDRARAPVVVSNLTAEPLGISSWAWCSLDPIPPETRTPGLVEVAPGTFMKPSELGVTQVAPGVALRSGTLDLPSARVGKVHVFAGAESGSRSDRLRREAPILPQGIQVRHVARAEGSGRSGSEEVLELALDLPDDVERATRTATLRVESTLLEAALAALPSLIDYPYGCTEQTLSRFEPLLVAAETAETLEVAPTGALARVAPLVIAGVERLAQLENPNGGFGWWAGESLHPEMTARALRALLRVRDAGVEEASERAGVLAERAAAALAARWPSLDPSDAPTAALVLAALAEAGAAPAGGLERALDTWGAEQAAPHVRALFLHAVLSAQRPEFARDLVAGLVAAAVPSGAGVRYAVRPAGEPGPERWQDDEIEATAVVLRALFAAGYRGEVLARGARWLLSKRVNGDSWRSTRDTAAAVAFLAPYGLTLRQAAGAAEYRVFSGERHVGTATRRADDPLAAGAEVALPASVLDQDRVLLRVVGPGGFSTALIVTGWATGPAIAGREHGLKVVRRWFRLDPQPADSGVVYVRTPVVETVPAGTLLECEVEVTTDRAREYVQVTDPHAAAFEPEREVARKVKDRPTALVAETQRYDDRTEFFVTSLPAGTHVLRHLVRATHAGAFTALPAQARLMYFPEVGGSSDGEQLEVSAPAGGAK